MRFKRQYGGQLYYLTANRGVVDLQTKDLKPEPLHSQFRDAALLTFHIEDAMACSDNWIDTRRQVCGILNKGCYCPEAAWETL